MNLEIKVAKSTHLNPYTQAEHGGPIDREYTAMHHNVRVNHLVALSMKLKEKSLSQRKVF